MHTLLGIRTDFSLGESIISCKDLPGIVTDTQALVVGLCDTMTVSSLVEANKVLAKIKTVTDVPVELIIGVRIRVIMAAEKEQESAYLKLYPVNDCGMKSIYRLLTRAFEEDRFYYVPRVTWADLHDLLDDNCLIITTGDLDSVVQRDDMSAALATLTETKSFCARFYELVPSDTPYYSRQNNRAIEWGLANDFEPLVIAPSLWTGGNKQAYSINASIAERRPYIDYLQPVPDYAPYSAQTMATATVKASQAITSRYGNKHGSAFSAGLKNTIVFVDMCQYRWVKQDSCLPVVASEPDLALKELCMKGWSERFKAPVFNHSPSPDELKNQYLPRLQFELNTLKTLGFAQYFLLVADLVRWSKDQGIYVGPGRGSVGGSLVAYLTGITDVDPIRFDLLFERFINPDRLDLPDADLDFMSGRREEVIRYLTKKYGEENVAGIVNYNTMGARSAVRDVGRIFGMAGDDLAATKTVGVVHGASQSLTEAHETSPDLQDFAIQNPNVWGSALTLEGKMRSYGTHAAGVIVAGEPIVNRAVIERRGSARVINWDKRVSEDQGLIKLDILGLSTLDMFDQAISLILKRHSFKLNINNIDLYDIPTLKVFTEAKTAGVFQLEGGSVRRLLKEMAKSAMITFDDIVALNALNRPGPLDAGLTESYIKRRAGEEPVSYPHNLTIPSLSTTYGVMVYQEQIMQISRDLCGFTRGEADSLRKAVGKKDAKMMATLGDKFINGAEQGTVTINLEDGRSLSAHRFEKFFVKESSEKCTLEEAFANNYTVDT